MSFSRATVAGLGLAAVAGLAAWSYASGGIVHALFVTPPDGAVGALRRYVLSFGPLAPAAYVFLVTIEVLVAPIPGAILYAPGGAIFGGLWGGTLSLAGNVIGAAAACWIAASFGERWMAERADGTELGAIRDRLRSRGGWIVFVLRVNPLTSSDLVSYAAGLAGVPVSRVAIATLAGMAPQCYVQAYLAASLFEFLPGSPAVLAGIATAIAAVIVWWALRPSRRRKAGEIDPPAAR
ncbi:MAG: VTT domain-containing protein [Vicinamibacterales bacterium]